MKSSILISSLLLVHFVYGQAKETRVQFKDLPAAVQKTAKQQEANGAVIRGYNKGVEKGKTFYEAETEVNGKNRDILMDGTGTIVEVEQQIDIGSLPPAVLEALTEQAAGAKILQVESVTKGDKTSYEASVEREGRRKEVAVNSDGSAVHEHD